MKKKLETIEVEIQLDLEKEAKLYTKPKLSESIISRLDEIVNEQKVISEAILKKKNQKEIDNHSILQVFLILKESFDRASIDRCEPEAIRAEKLIELYGKEITLSALITRLKHFIKSEYNNEYILIRKTKNKKPAYILIRS